MTQETNARLHEVGADPKQQQTVGELTRPRARSDNEPSLIYDDDLSPRECEIVRLVAKGLPNKTIAAVLEISHHTVQTYLNRMFHKKQVHARAALVAKVFRNSR